MMFVCLKFWKVIVWQIDSPLGISSRNVNVSTQNFLSFSSQKEIVILFRGAFKLNRFPVDEKTFLFSFITCFAFTISITCVTELILLKFFSRTNWMYAVKEGNLFLCYWNRSYHKLQIYAWNCIGLSNFKKSIILHTSFAKVFSCMFESCNNIIQ